MATEKPTLPAPEEYVSPAAEDVQANPAVTAEVPETQNPVAEAEAAFAGQGYGIFKPAVAESVIELLRPIREEAERLMKDKAYLEDVLRDGAERAAYAANRTLRKVYKKVGFVAR